MKFRPHHFLVHDVCSPLFEWAVISAVIVCAFVLFADPSLAQDSDKQADDPIAELRVENLWLLDPDLTLPAEILKFDPAYRPLWMEAIQHPEADLQQEIAAMFDRVQRAGNDDYSDQADVFRKLILDDNHHTLNVALASLLCTIDDRDSADRLFEILNPKRIELSQVVEPALARWDYKPIREIWRSRLDDPGVRRSHLVLAIEGLMQVRDEPAADRLLEMAMDRREKSALRIAAARAVGHIHSDGLLSAAQQLSADVSAEGIINRLCAVAFLARHESEPANELLQRLSLDAEPTVAAGAWRRLLQIDSALAVTQADDCLTNDDPIVRGLAVQSLFEQPTVVRIDQLGVMMDDRHPDVRKAARISLHRLALVSDEFDRRVRVAGMKSVQESASGYRGVEQALLLLGALDHKNVAGVAVELLEHDHPRVLVTAAWTLRVLQVKETLPSMLDRALRVSDVYLGKKYKQQTTVGGAAGLDQIAHLFDAFGQMEYHAAEDLLRKYIPKQLDLGANSRPAAIGAIGRLNQGHPDPKLVAQLVARLHDWASDPGEIFPVCSMSAIALGRMKANSAVKDLERYFLGKPPRGLLDYSSAWSIREITGRDFPAPVAQFAYKSGFNLTPGRARIEAARKQE
jgi:hypothetical protein